MISDKVLDTIELADCNQWLLGIPDNSIDVVHIDPPYGVTNTSWDILPNWEFLREQFRRILKKSGSLFVWGVQPLLTEIHYVFRESFTMRFEWIWNKLKNSHLGGNLPIRIHENLWWYVHKSTPVSEIYSDIASIKVIGDFYKASNGENPLNKNIKHGITTQTNRYYPKSIYTGKKPRIAAKDKHPTQKLDKIIHDIIKYTCPPNGIILDCFAGSARFAMIARSLKRHFMGCELDPSFYQLAQRNLASTENTLEKWI